MERFVPCIYNDLYLVGDQGTIVSKQPRHKGEKQLKPYRKKDGYVTVSIQGIGPQFIHRLVAIHHLPTECFDLDVNHKNGIKHQNNVENLEWSTRSRNIQHSYSSLGRTIAKGEKHHRYGKKHSAEIRRKMSHAKKGKNHPKWKGFYLIHGVKYTTSTEAAKALNTSNNTILRRIKRGVEGYSFLSEIIKNNTKCHSNHKK